MLAGAGGGALSGLPHDIRGLLPFVVPWWMIVLAVWAAGSALAALGLGIWALVRKHNQPRPEGPVDPWDVLKLRVLKLEPDLPFTGKPAENYFYELSLMLREAVEMRTRIPATDLTLKELKGPLESKLPLPKGETEAVLDFLARADLVKFAGAPSTVDEAKQARASVGSWVTRLRPLSIDLAPGAVHGGEGQADAPR